jgi:hypothetical protein
MMKEEGEEELPELVRRRSEVGSTILNPRANKRYRYPLSIN